jgi:hypothetical protein
MKLLTVLPENYSETVKPRKGDIQVLDNKATTITIRKPVFIKGATFYRIDEDKLVGLTPEPRPADSIKLSECEPHHLVEYRNYGEQSHLIFRFIDGYWSDGVNECRSLMSILGHATLSHIRIYDMTQ